MKIAHKGGPQPCQLSPVDIGTIVQYAQQLQVLIWRDLQRSEADFGVLCKPSDRSSQQAKRKPPLGLRINLRMKFLHQIFVLTSDIDAATWQVPGKQVGQLTCGFAKSRAGSIV